MVIESYGALVFRQDKLVAWSPLFATREEAHQWAAPYRAQGLRVVLDAGPGRPGPRTRRQVVEPGSWQPRRAH